MKNHPLLSLISMLLVAGVPSAIAQPRVVTENGTIEGKTSSNLKVFKGIPYARPPVGDLRWRSPQPVQPQNGILRAYEYGADCPQKTAGRQSEDCLFLNVWAPQQPGKYPVMVWIHGGGFINGSGKINGEAFAKQGIVFVSMNYRLGRFGSFAHPALSAEVPAGVPVTNFWLQDQVAALKWVQKNIGQFGGDPKQVTIFGVSAGGTSVNMLMASPLAKGLFQRAISQSGISGYLPLQRVDQPYLNIPSQMSMGRTFAEKQNIQNSANAAKSLRNLPWQTIARDPTGVGPVVDGIAIPDDLRNIFRDKKQHQVPFIVGANSYEGNLSLVIPWGEEPLKQMIRQDIDRLAPLYGKSTNDPSLWIDLYGDVFFRTSARYLAANANAWHYHFDYVYQSLKPYTPGAGHGSEVPFLFGNLPRSPFRPGAGLAKLLGIPNQDYPIVSADYELARQMQSYWINFAKTGNPNGAGLPAWLRYASNNPVTLVYGQNGIKGVRNLDKQRLDMLMAIFDQFLSGKNLSNTATVSQSDSNFAVLLKARVNELFTAIRVGDIAQCMQIIDPQVVSRSGVAETEKFFQGLHRLAKLAKLGTEDHRIVSIVPESATASVVTTEVRLGGKWQTPSREKWILVNGTWYFRETLSR